MAKHRLCYLCFFFTRPEFIDHFTFNHWLLLLISGSLESFVMPSVSQPPTGHADVCALVLENLQDNCGMHSLTSYVCGSQLADHFDLYHIVGVTLRYLVSTLGTLMGMLSVADCTWPAAIMPINYMVLWIYCTSCKYARSLVVVFPCMQLHTQYNSSTSAITNWIIWIWMTASTL